MLERKDGRDFTFTKKFVRVMQKVKIYLKFSPLLEFLRRSIYSKKYLKKKSFTSKKYIDILLSKNFY